MKSKRNRYNPTFKAKVALAAIQEQQTIAEIGKQYGVHPVQVQKWKKQLLENVSRAFEKETGNSDSADREAELLKKIGELTVERDFLSRALGR
jgi:transposase-like protein